MQKLTFPIACLASFIVAFTTPCRAAERSPEILAKEVYTILNRACFECHGPTRQDGSLRLDSREAIAAGGDSGSPIDSDEPQNSDLLRRIRLSKGDEEVMPKRGDVLGKREVNLIREWIARGAPWSDNAAKETHWSYTSPKKPLIPSLDHNAARHPIDAMVQARLEQEGLKPSKVADSRVLARRLFLDITGLPPNPSEVESFASEAAIDMQTTVESWVDRLLNSPQYGEKWARPWLDAARYADSHGFQRDDLHEIWAYRDWVIQALNADMPFDQFTIEQLAGDLLPNPTESQIIATGFNRCAPCNVEAGTDPEENRFNQVVDRVNTLGYVWLGSTLECAQCHNHKYDPFTQKDYYGLFAFFNQSELEADRANPKVPGSIKFIGPYMELDRQEGQRENVEFDAKIAKAKTKLDVAIKKEKPSKSEVQSSSSVRILKPLDFESKSGSNYELLDDGSILLRDDNTPDIDTYSMTIDISAGPVVGLLLEAMTDPSLPGTGPGRGDSARPNFVLTAFEVRAVDSSGKAIEKSIPLTDAKSDFSQDGFDASKAIDNQKDRYGWAISPKFKEPHWAAFHFANPTDLEGTTQLNIQLIQNHGGARSIGRFRLSAIAENYSEAIPNSPTDSPQIAALRKSLATLESQRDKKPMLKTLVMRDIEQPRMSTMYSRGDFRSPGDSIAPHTPAVLHRYESSGSNNRLTLAKWLVSSENPLVSRVVVNRLWLEVFGAGLVATPEDFGLKGDLPTHPDLLDWLAIEFVENGWSQKQLLRTILVSQTYRQSSKITPELLDRDPNNALLARGPRVRLSAESIRDNALAISGTLSLKQFGPPIRPPQPDGLWKKVGGEQYDYQVSPGEDQFRRGVYVVLKRMSPYPSFINFDATARLACRVNRGRSNTPLQALTLLNDPVYVAAAQSFSKRILEEVKTANLDEQLAYAFQLAVARIPNVAECDALRKLFEFEKAARDSSTSQSDAWFAVASAILNLDETITKE
ncbi:MAG: PSD1 and planctomycete cytochrome C domain-containing protein [Pirellulaceae bacterium]|nr:PSD1 and planctomycete cytochrome C domain-containing protein [Pirellulaceae bacterium]